MCCFACAAGTLRAAARKKIAAKTPKRLRNDRLPSGAGQHALQAFLELGLRLPAEELLRAGDVGLADLWVVDRQRLVDDLALRARDAQHRFRELIQGELTRIADVHRQVL